MASWYAPTSRCCSSRLVRTISKLTTTRHDEALSSVANHLEPPREQEACGCLTAGGIAIAREPELLLGVRQADEGLEDEAKEALTARAQNHEGSKQAVGQGRKVDHALAP